MATYSGSDKRIKYLFDNGGGGGSSSLAGLSDVNLSSPADGQVLTYHASSGKWINATGGAGGGVNYSTTEQVVGTWIDGKTIYQKTLVIPSFSASTYEWGWYAGSVNISSEVPNMSQAFAMLEACYITLQDNTTRGAVFIDLQNPATPTVYFPGTSRSGTLTLTLRYTKSS